MIVQGRVGWATGQRLIQALKRLIHIWVGIGQGFGEIRSMILRMTVLRDAGCVGTIRRKKAVISPIMRMVLRTITQNVIVLPLPLLPPLSRALRLPLSLPLRPLHHRPNPLPLPSRLRLPLILLPPLLAPPTPQRVVKLFGHSLCITTPGARMGARIYLV